jgi:DNA invertase Pin-like site-specific DNA recombinase
VRQSTRQQVLDHGESTRLQYGLVERAVALGWQTSRVVVIDEDLGKSGSSAAGRVGFQRLVTEITMGHVGLVLGIEMSRLARSGADWYQLLELCALSGALLADADGVYDPVECNDRLLLGLKGTMSEAELHLPGAADAGRQAGQGTAGELAIALPTGYVRRGSGEAALDPDEQVQTVVRLIFAKFAELGTLHAVLRWLVDHDVELGMRLRAGPDKGELVWRRPNRMTLQNILHSPIYAGIYADGRRRVDPRRQPPGRPSTGRVVRTPDQWLVAIPGVLPAYITVEQYHANLARLAANAARAETPGVVRAGSALLSGLARCGRCGQRMAVRYHLRGQATAPEYVCARQLTDYGAGQRCQALAGACVDTLVTQQVLAALTPAAIEVSLQAAAQVRAERAELKGLWAQRLERAQVAAALLPAGRAGEPPGRAPAGGRLGSRAGHPAAPARGLRPLHPHLPATAYPRPAAGHHRPRWRHPRPVGRANHHRRRPQAAYPRAGGPGHHHRGGQQRTRGRSDRLGWRAHHPRSDHPPGRPP